MRTAPTVRKMLAARAAAAGELAPAPPAAEISELRARQEKLDDRAAAAAAASERAIVRAQKARARAEAAREELRAALAARRAAE